MRSYRALPFTYRRMLVIAFLSVVSLVHFGYCANNTTLGSHFDYPFKTEPRLIPLGFDLEVYEDLSRLAPGYIFVNPSHYGPVILDQHGELVWSGLDTARGASSNLKPCDHLGSIGTHLCFYDGLDILKMHTQGYIRVLDNSYEQVGDNYEAANDLGNPDGHDINIPSGGYTLLQDVYNKHKRDLRPYGGDEDSWVVDCCIQEVDMATHKSLFQWCSGDEVEIWETQVWLESSSNNTNGTWSFKGTKWDPWDYCHVNSLAKNSDGDYFVSARHMSAIIKIAGLNHPNPGSVIWRLNGNYSDFEMDFDFFRQHNIRHVESTSETELLSLLNNNCDGRSYVADSSEGQLIEVNNKTMKARLVQAYVRPDRQLNPIAGTTTVLPNKNVLVGWGGPWGEWQDVNHFTEFDYNGTALVHGTYTGSVPGTASYGVFKAPWIGKPKTKPKVVAYKQSCPRYRPVYVYISWNGATEVSDWEIFSGEKRQPKSLKSSGVFPKRGFETKIRLSSLQKYVQVHGVGSNGTVLGKSAVEQLFVPTSAIQPICNEESCKQMFNYTLARHLGWSKTCDQNDSFWFELVTAPLGFAVIIECLSWITQFLLTWEADISRTQYLHLQDIT